MRPVPVRRAIGGFLPLRLPSSGPGASPLFSQWISKGTDVLLLHTARSALHALWSFTKPQRIFLPAYICPEVRAAVPDGVEVRYFGLSELLEPDHRWLDANLRTGDHVLAVDYFGRPVGEDFKTLVDARPQIGWIEDRAHALDPGPAWGDWLLYSPRKLVGVPDGGILVSRGKPAPIVAAEPLDDLSFLLPVLARFEDRNETDNETWYAQYRRAESGLNCVPTTMSRITAGLLRLPNGSDDGALRRSNYKVLHERLARYALFPDPVVAYAPLGFPMRVSSASALVGKLARRRVFAARHWSALPSDPGMHPTEHRLAEELITLPCDYRYDESDMDYMADIVLEAVLE